MTKLQTELAALETQRAELKNELTAARSEAYGYTATPIGRSAPIESRSPAAARAQAGIMPLRDSLATLDWRINALRPMYLE